MQRPSISYFVIIPILAAVATAYAGLEQLLAPRKQCVGKLRAGGSRHLHMEVPNDGYDTITDLQFSYAYRNADTGRYQTDKDCPAHSAEMGCIHSCVASSARHPDHEYQLAVIHAE